MELLGRLCEVRVSVIVWLGRLFGVKVSVITVCGHAGCDKNVFIKRFKYGCFNNKTNCIIRNDRIFYDVELLYLI